MAAKEENSGEKTITLTERLISILKKDSRGFEIGTYGLTSIGLLTALYRIRPFAKFSNPQKVPLHFIRNQTVLRGTVARIEPGNVPLLLVNHRPLLNIPRFGEPKYLPVKITAVNVNNHGVSWLSTIVKGNQIEFIPMKKTKEFLDCTITMQQKNNEILQIGEELVKLGFGRVEEPLSNLKNTSISSYIKSLTSAQKLAKFKRNGEWHFTIPPTIWWKIKIHLSSKLAIRS